MNECCCCCAKEKRSFHIHLVRLSLKQNFMIHDMPVHMIHRVPAGVPTAMQLERPAQPQAQPGLPGPAARVQDPAPLGHLPWEARQRPGGGERLDTETHFKRYTPTNSTATRTQARTHSCTNAHTRTQTHTHHCFSSINYFGNWLFSEPIF